LDGFSQRRCDGQPKGDAMGYHQTTCRSPRSPFVRRSSGGGQPEFLRNLRSADCRADLEEQTVRLPELSFPCRFVAGQSSQLNALDVGKRLVFLRSRHLDPGAGFRERI
jgi:hypothetical protein